MASGMCYNDAISFSKILYPSQMHTDIHMTHTNKQNTNAQTKHTQTKHTKTQTKHAHTNICKHGKHKYLQNNFFLTQLLPTNNAKHPSSTHTHVC